MPIRRVLCDEIVEENRGKTSISRGPLVYCVEWCDVEDEHVLNLLLPDDLKLKTEFRPDLLNGIQVICGTALAYTVDDATGKETTEVVTFTAIPYYAWEHRGAGEMTVWISREEQVVRPKAIKTLAETSAVGFSKGINPEHRYYHWNPSNGNPEWIQYTFESPKTISEARVYWFDDTDNRDKEFPSDWRILYKNNGDWIPVNTTSEFGKKRDTYNTVAFEPVETEALRLEITMPEVSGGIIDLQIK